MITIYCYDASGYFLYETLAQEGEGIYLPENATTIKPKQASGYWYKFDTDKNKWVAEKKPTAVSDLLNITYNGDDTSERGLYLRALFEDAMQDDNYIVEIEDNVWSLREKTLDEYKTMKLQDNDDAYADARGGVITVNGMSICNNDATVQTLQTAVILLNSGGSFTFVDENGTEFAFNEASDAVNALTELSNINTQNAILWKNYKTAIEAAESITVLKAMDFSDYITGEK